MTKKISIYITVIFMLISSSCTTYNSLVPDWATLGNSTSVESSESVKNDNNDSSWWNPFSWF